MQTTRPALILMSLLLMAAVAAIGQRTDASAEHSPVAPPEVTDPVMLEAAESGDGFLITAEEVESAEGPRGRWIRLERNVTITRHGATLIGDHGVYWELARMAVVHGNVHGEDRGSRVACDTLKFLRDEDVAILIGSASYADSTGVLTADRIELHHE
ncbi:hypothetical protein K8S17_00415, partial [bacterium]|nr:hypothetical protein [bacterium]